MNSANFAERGETAEPAIEQRTCNSGQHEDDPDLRDTVDIPPKVHSEQYFAREILPYAPDA